ncbi:MAG TPA: type II toxin-antitoxin system prevent-host-death family antitoxin [Solirubrobacteraceae bacterium]|nr:type II toxin-antitoxin system prevent-host-death family antitoxin [Solirubrobacteraceae bacterium]
MSRFSAEQGRGGDAGREPAASPNGGRGPSGGSPPDAETWDGVTQVGIRGLARNVSAVVAEVAASGRPAVVTKHGAPLVAIVPIEPGDSADTVLARARFHLEELAEADRSSGRRRSAAEVFAELGRLAEAMAYATSLEHR